MTTEELKQRIPTMQEWFRRRERLAGEIESLDDIRIGGIYRMDLIDENGKAVRSEKSMIFTPMSGWDRYVRGTGASLMRVRRADGRHTEIRDLDFCFEVAVMTRLA
jgi:hypothetical protein